MSEEYCKYGHKRQRVPSNILYPQHYYCSTCDKIFIPTYREISKEEFNKDFLSDRYTEMVEAKRYIAMSKVTREDLKKLGYL